MGKIISFNYKEIKQWSSIFLFLAIIFLVMSFIFIYSSCSLINILAGISPLIMGISLFISTALCIVFSIIIRGNNQITQRIINIIFWLSLFVGIFLGPVISFSYQQITLWKINTCFSKIIADYCNTDNNPLKTSGNENMILGKAIIINRNSKKIDDSILYINRKNIAKSMDELNYIIIIDQTKNLHNDYNPQYTKTNTVNTYIESVKISVLDYKTNARIKMAVLNGPTVPGISSASSEYKFTNWYGRVDSNDIYNSIKDFFK